MGEIMDRKEFLNKLETGLKPIELGSVEDFLEAAKICRKKYGKKSVLPADVNLYKQCIVVMQKEPEKANGFGVHFSIVREYLRKNKLDFSQFNNLYIPEYENERKLILERMQMENRLLKKFRSLSHKKKKIFIDHMNDYLKTCKE